MELRDLAERVLFGTTLDDKLVRAAAWTDRRPGAASVVPAGPGRPAGLEPVRRARQGFPSVTHLDRPGVRAEMLHRFANHELLAMELMALALLRFPDAPPAFRRGLAQALVEEQEHFELYHARLMACGGELGTVPASPLFWDMLSPMAEPLDFVVGMSMTFEQANLDYAGYYRRAFAKAGDHETAAVLDRVYEDEIGHVKLGLVWFRKWLQPEDDWQAFTTALPEQLQPSRAKGIEFDAEARRRAGFDGPFIDRLRVYTRSKGRVPALYAFDPRAELQLAGRPAPPPVEQLCRDLQTLPMFLCARDDAIRVDTAPRPAFLARLAEAGFELPEFVVEPRGRRFSAHRPWAAVPAAADAGLPAFAPTPPALFGKDYAVRLRRRLADQGAFDRMDGILDPIGVCHGAICHDADAVADAITDVIGGGSRRAVLKAALGTAGQAMQVVDGAPPRKWTARTLAAGPIVVEPWRDRVLDLGVQLDVGETVKLRGITRNLVDRRGRYRGVALVKMAAGLPADLRRWLMGRGVPSALEQIGIVVGEALRAAGHRGAAGVDAMVYRVDGGYRLQPIVEINPRFTMGRVALGLRPRIARGASAVWLQMAAADAPAPRLVTRGRPPLITDAELPTTDPEGARFTTMLFVAPTFDGLRERIGDRVATVDPAFD